MNFLARPINGTLGSAIAISNGAGEEHRLAIFADASIEDLAPIDEHRCVLISRKRGVAVVDLSSREVVKRGRLPWPADRIAVAKDGARALAYHCNPGLLAFIDLASLASIAEFNLIQLREDGAFDLINRDHEALREAKTPWQSIPYSDGPLRIEVAADDMWLRYAAEAPTGLRRMHFTRSAGAVFRADGRVVIPFEFRVNGPTWVTDKVHARPITESAHVFSVGVAVIDEAAVQAEMRVIRQRSEASVYTRFPIRSISPDGTRAILQSFDPLVQPTASEGPAFGGMLRKFFGRGPGGQLAFGLEQWNIERAPKLETAFAIRSLDGDTLLPTNTQRFSDAELGEARREIDRVFPGIEAGFHDRRNAWLSSRAKHEADTYFDPLETRQAPVFIPAFDRSHYPPLFAELARRLVELHPKPFSEIPWDRIGDRESRLMGTLLRGWSEHSDHAAASMVWVGSDRFVTFSCDGKVLEVSASGGIGHIYQLVDPEKHVWPFPHDPLFRPLQHEKDRTFALEFYNFRLEFELPPFAKAGTGTRQRATPLSYRMTIDRGRYDAEVKQVDRLTDKIRHGYVKIGGKDPDHIIKGLHDLAQEVRHHLSEIVVDARWIPTLYHRGKPVTETELCDILIAEGSKQAVLALDGLLTAFLDATEGRRQEVWHTDDVTPTMGPVSMALIRLCDPLPPSIARFYARRDMDHDMWTIEAFERLDLPQKRCLAPDLATLQIRLAIQDICTGNNDPNIFAYYRLHLLRAALHANPSLVSELTDMIVDQTEAQAPNLTWASKAGVTGVLNAIAESLDKNIQSEADLAVELLRRAEVRHA